MLWTFKVQHSFISFDGLLVFGPGDYAVREGSHVLSVEYGTFWQCFGHPTIGDECGELESLPWPGSASAGTM